MDMLNDVLQSFKAHIYSIYNKFFSSAVYTSSACVIRRRTVLKSLLRSAIAQEVDLYFRHTRGRK